MDTGIKENSGLDGASLKNDAKLSKDEYFKLLNDWTNLQSAFRAMACFPLAMAQMNHPAHISSGVTAETNSRQQNIPNSFRLLFNPERAEEIIRTNGGFELVIAPLYKRFLAEVIDTVLLFIVKIIFFVFFLDFFHIGLDIDLKFLEDMKFLEDDYSQLLSLSSDFLVLEFLTKIFFCLYEAFFTVKLQASPGKLIMGIRILHASAVMPLEQQINHTQGIRALVFPASQLTFKRALFRSLAKNLLVTLLFPVYFMLFFYKSNQLIYDLLGKTVVVDYNPNAVLRRRNQ